MEGPLTEGTVPLHQAYWKQTDSWQRRRGDDLGRAIGNAVEAEVEVLLLTASVVASVLALAAGRRAPLGYEGPQER